MTRLTRALLASAVVTMALGGCHRDQKATGHGTVSGEILPGSVSDAMLPYDSVKSKAPLAPPEPVERPGEDNAADSADTDAALPSSATPDAPVSVTPPVPAAGN